ncbi:YafY family protein [Jeotgalibacillus sp. R-1-5s-1]|uniref:helix-turn-helix transcriptional regulator n=1 Tax=Jeotgalibacillus sp. R-1-5s-1 TaxID=2555897 RepID=UPI00141B3706|nr:YafY family protein [Jeotgalibacillus sp. R-1-5s-1]
MNERQLTMMRMLDPGRSFTARELAERFDVSVRTIQRDLDKLQELGYPLYSEPGRYGGYRVLPNRIMPPLQLNENEALGLYLIMNTFQQIPDLPFGQIRSFLAENYFTELPASTREKIRRVEKKVVFKASSVNRESKWTTVILEAALEQRELKLTYESAKGISKRSVFPIGLYFDQSWYMPAFYREKVLLFRVDRIISAEWGENQKDDLPTLIDWLAFPENREEVKVVLSFTDEGERRAKADPFYQDVKDRRWEGGVPLEELDFTATGLLSYGPHVKVEEPKSLETKLKMLYQKALDQYD